MLFVTSLQDVTTVHGFEEMQSVMASWSMEELKSRQADDRESSRIEEKEKEKTRSVRMFYGSPTAAVQDDFSYWNSEHESDHSGKLFLVNTDRVQVSTHSYDTSSSSNSDDVNSSYAPMQIFFDDNIERDRAHIVDVRDAKTFERIPFSFSENVFIRKVEPNLAIVNENYFIETLHEMIDAQIKFRHRRQS
jgi:hypothetical protein